MIENKEYNILLLKVMAHDLLAPLTAIKWQTELLQKHVKEEKKRVEYLEGIESSTEMGISIAKHTHVASNILAQTYEGLTEQGNLSKCVEETVDSLRLQYERHGLTQETSIETNDHEGVMDTQLTQLYIWSIAKFFLTVTPPNTTVNAVGKEGEGNTYTLTISAPEVPDQDTLIRIFSEGGVEGEFDQKYVFIKLINTITPVLNADIQIHKEEEKLAISATFK